METKTLLAAVRDAFYGGQGVAAMRADWQKLTDQDKADLTAWFEAEGQPILRKAGEAAQP